MCVFVCACVCVRACVCVLADPIVRGFLSFLSSLVITFPSQPGLIPSRYNAHTHTHTGGPVKEADRLSSKTNLLYESTSARAQSLAFCIELLEKSTRLIMPVQPIWSSLSGEPRDALCLSRTPSKLFWRGEKADNCWHLFYDTPGTFRAGIITGRVLFKSAALTLGVSHTRLASPRSIQQSRAGKRIQLKVLSVTRRGERKETRFSEH